MIYNSWEWKQELSSLINKIELYSLASQRDEKSAEIDARFELEKAIAYSAFATRLIIDAEKLSQEVLGENISTVEYQPLKQIDFWEKWFDERCFDFDHPLACSRSATFIINQIIHSYTILTFSVDEENNVTGFFISSDFQKSLSLIWVSLDKWLYYLKKVERDEIVSSHGVRNPKTGKWTIRNSNTSKYMERNPFKNTN